MFTKTSPITCSLLLPSKPILQLNHNQLNKKESFPSLKTTSTLQSAYPDCGLLRNDSGVWQVPLLHYHQHLHPTVWLICGSGAPPCSLITDNDVLALFLGPSKIIMQTGNDLDLCMCSIFFSNVTWIYKYCLLTWMCSHSIVFSLSNDI